MMRFLVFGALLFSIIGCEIKPAKIEYGRDGCHFCSMTIVDNQHAAQIVTDKGKSYKFDAIECMLNDLKKRQTDKVGMLLINDYNKPGDLIKAEEATFIISEAIPSPMGAFLSASYDKEGINALKNSKGGEIYTWTSIKEKFKVD